MRFGFEVLVTLKEGLADPAAKAVEAALPAMGWTNVSDVHVGKHIRLDVEASGEAEALAQVDEIARRLLSNPVIEEFRIVETSGGSS
jgi:phosphoribosylformylglycinamidine synthase subunit PurS